MALTPFLTCRLAFCHWRKPRASIVPEKKQTVRFRNDQACRGMFFGAGYWEKATLAGMLPDLNWSKILLRTDLTFLFIAHLLWFGVQGTANQERRGYFFVYIISYFQPFPNHPLRNSHPFSNFPTTQPFHRSTKSATRPTPKR